MQRQDMSDDSDKKVESVIPTKNHTAMEFNGPVQSAIGVVHGDVHYHNNRNLPREPEAKEPLPKIFQPDIPFFVESRFVKRNTLLSQIESTFLVDQNVAQQRCAMTALTACHGLGGVGKTQLALYYYHKSEKLYPLRCWFSAERLDAGYRGFCKKFQVKVDEKASFEEISRKVKQWLEEHPGWLLVYDNVADCNSIAPHLPTTGGDILVTSRHTLEWDQIGGREISIDVVSETEAIELVKRALSSNVELVLLEEQEEVNLKKLVSELGCLPLALAQAAAYIKSCPGMTITSYLDKYKNTPDVYLDKALNPRTYPTSVAKTWLITMEEIEKRLPAALPVFKACAYLAPDAVPRQLLSKLTLELNSSQIEDKEGEDEETKLNNNPLLDEILICLSSFSMIGRDQKESYINIHRLVQAVIRQEDDKELSSNEERFEKRYKRLSDALIKVYTFWSKRSNKSIEYHSIARLLQPHIEIVIKYLRLLGKETHKSILLVESSLCSISSRTLSQILGHVRKAIDYKKRALKIDEEHYGQDSMPVAISLTNLGQIYNSLGDYENARDFLERALKIKEIHCGENNNEVAITLISLAVTEGCLGNRQKKRDYSERALKIMDAHYGEEYWETTTAALVNLGNAYGSLGDHVKKRDYLERALKIEETHGKNHVKIVSTLVSLGNAYGSLGDHAKKRDLLERALEIDLAHYGKDHVKVAITLVNLGNAYGSLDDHAKKRDYLENALRINVAHYGENHVEVALVLTNLGDAYYSLGDYEKARDHLEHALRVHVGYYRENHVQVAVTLANLGPVYDSLGNRAKARDCLERALEIFVNDPGYGEQHKYTQEVRSLLLPMIELPVQPEITAPLKVEPKEKEEKQKATAGFFDKERLLLDSLIKKYELLDDNQSSLEQGLRKAAENGCLEDLELFARYVKNLNAQDENPQSQKTAAHWAAVKGHEDCYNFLVLGKKVRIDIPDASNKTASEYKEAKIKTPEDEDNFENAPLITDGFFSKKTISNAINQEPISVKTKGKECRCNCILM